MIVSKYGKVEVVCILDRREAECHGNSITSGVGVQDFI